MKLFKLIVSIMTTYALIFSPLAYAGGNTVKAERGDTDVALVKQFLQDSGWATGKLKTYGDLWNYYKDNLPRSMQGVYEPLFVSMWNEPLPKVELQTIKNGKRNVARILVTDQNKQVTTVDYLAENPQKIFKMNGTILSFADFMSGDLNGKITGSEKDAKDEKEIFKKAQYGSIELSPALYAKMSKYQRALYLVQVRRVYDATVEVQSAFGDKITADNDNSSKVEFVQRLVAGEFADAGEKNCVVAGYAGEYSKGRCAFASINYSDRQTGEGGYISKFAGQYLERDRLSKLCTQPNTFACNPLVFGFDGDKPYCTSSSYETAQTATAQCNGASPVDTPDKAATFLQSLMKISKNDSDIGKYLTADGKKYKDEDSRKKVMELYINPLNDYITKLEALCNRSNPLDKNQGSACHALEERRTNLQTYVAGLGVQMGTTPPVTPPVTPPGGGVTTPPVTPPVADMKCEKPRRQTAGGACVCPSHYAPVGKECHFYCVGETQNYRLDPDGHGLTPINDDPDDAGDDYGTWNSSHGGGGHGGVAGGGAGGSVGGGVGDNGHRTAGGGFDDDGSGGGKGGKGRPNRDDWKNKHGGGAGGKGGEGAGGVAGGGAGGFDGRKPANGGGGPSIDPISCSPDHGCKVDKGEKWNSDTKKCEKEKCEGKKKGCWTCGCWLKPALIIGAIGLGIWALLSLRHKKKSHPSTTYVPPACDPAVSMCNGDYPTPTPVTPPGPIQSEGGTGNNGLYETPGNVGGTGQ